MFGEFLKGLLPDKKKIIQEKMAQAFINLSKEFNCEVTDLRIRIYCTDIKVQYKICVFKSGTEIKEIPLDFILTDMAEYHKTVSDKIRIFLLDVSESEALHCPVNEVMLGFIPHSTGIGIALYRYVSHEGETKVSLIREVSFDEII